MCPDCARTTKEVSAGSTGDPVYSVANAEDEITRFVNSVGAELRVVQDGQHFLSASNPDDVNTAAVGFINRWK